MSRQFETSVRFRSPLGRALHDWWFGLSRPAGTLVPLKSSLNPAAIPKLLPWLIMHDLREPGRSMLRLIGTGLVEKFGFDATGHDYARYVAAERRPQALHELAKVARHPCGMRVITRHMFGSGKHIVGESTGFPFEADDGSGRFLLFIDDAIERPTFHDPRERPLEVIGVHEREYIDIGAGVPRLED